MSETNLKETKEKTTSAAKEKEKSVLWESSDDDVNNSHFKVYSIFLLYQPYKY